MSFDPRSLERLKELGRHLPTALPNPETETKASTKSNRPKHKVETEQNPETLFHELMSVSQDGTVPEHLMSRLRSAEQRLEDERRQRQVSTPRHSTQGSATDLPSPPARSTGKGKNSRPQRPNVPAGSEEDSLYVAFSQLLLEDDDSE